MRVFILSVESGVEECVEMFGLKHNYFLITRLNLALVSLSGQDCSVPCTCTLYLECTECTYIIGEPSDYFTVVVKYIVHTPIIVQQMIQTSFRSHSLSHVGWR